MQNFQKVTRRHQNNLSFYFKFTHERRIPKLWHSWWKILVENLCNFCEGGKPLYMTVYLSCCYAFYSVLHSHVISVGMYVGIILEILKLSEGQQKID